MPSGRSPRRWRMKKTVVLLWVKQLLWLQAGFCLGQTRVRVHATSLVENLWKLWRRGVCNLESCLEHAGVTHGGLYWKTKKKKTSIKKNYVRRLGRLFMGGSCCRFCGKEKTKGELGFVQAKQGQQDIFAVVAFW